MVRIFSFLVLLIAAVNAGARHESKKRVEASSPEVASKGSEESATKKHAEREAELAEKSSKEASTGGEGFAQQGDYQKFMKQSGGDYSKYMGSGSDGSSQGGDWNKYMAQYGGNSQGGDFKQYMDKYTGGQGAGGMGGNYQQFMKQYAGDYMGANHGKKGESSSAADFQQYMHQADASPSVSFAAAADSKVDAKHESKKAEEASSLEVAQKSSKEATTGGEGFAQQGDYQKFMKQFGGDYSKYMGSGSDGSSQGGDWNKYMAQYGGNRQGGDFKQYMDKYTGGQGAGGMGGNYQQFMKQYAGDYMGAKQGRKGESSSAADFQQYMHQADANPSVSFAAAADSKVDAKDESKSQGGDFKQYMDKYTSGQGGGGMGGNYQQFMKQYAGDYMGAKQGRKGESSSAADFQQYMHQAHASPSVSFAAAADSKVDAKQAAAAAEAAKLQTAEGNATSRAQHHVEELRKLAAVMEANMKSNVANMVSSIESEAREAFGDQRRQLQQEWVAKLKALNATELATAKWDAVERALDAAADADDQLRNLDWEEFKAIRHAYDERREAKKSQVRSLSHEARSASHEAKHLGRHVEHRRRAEGVQEHVYEREWAHSEHSSEGLARDAEKAGEAAEEAVEKEFERVEGHLEKRLDALKESAAKEHKARKRAEAKAKKDVVEARSAAHQRAESQASAGSPTLFVELAAADDKDQAAAGDDQDKAATGHHQDKAEPSAGEKPSKQEIAQKRLAEATQQMEGIVEMLRQLVTREHENIEKNAKDTVKAIVAGAHQKVQEHRQQVEEEWQRNLKALSAESLAHAKGEEVHRAFEAAVHAQDKLSEVDHRQVDAEREAYDQMRRKQDNEVRKLAEHARKASDRMDEFGRRLKDHDAQDKAARQSERLQREGEDAADKVEDDIDKKFRLVRDLLDRYMREEEKAAKQEQHDRHESRQKAEEAVHAARRVARRAAEEAHSKATSAPPVAFLARSADATPLPAELLAGVAFCFGAVALAAVVRTFSSRRVRLNEQPALG